MLEHYVIGYNMDLQYSNLWEFVFIPNPLNLAGIKSALQGGLLKFKITSSSLPFWQFNLETRKTHEKFYSSIEALEDFSLTFLETTTFSTLGYLEDWLDDVYDFENKVFKTGYHKRNAMLFFETYFPVNYFNTQGNQLTTRILESTIPEVPNRIYIFQELNIKGITNIELDYESGNPLLITANFSVNDIKKSNVTKTFDKINVI